MFAKYGAIQLIIKSIINQFDALPLKDLGSP